MFFNSELLTKRGPLARVWMASHLSTATKLNKSILLQTSIPSTVTSILGEALLPMALRLSGQLLLGVTRIYQRKAKYLLDDCNETLLKVKKAFKPGQVDLEEDHTGGEAITLRRGEGQVEDLLLRDEFQWDQMDFAIPVNAALAGPQAQARQAAQRRNNEANLADITLAEQHDAYGYAEDDYAPVFDYGEEGALEEEFELGLFDEPEVGRKRARDENEDDVESVELGRRASLAPSSVGVGPFDLTGKDDRLGSDLGGEEMRFDDFDMQVGEGGGSPNRELTPLNGDFLNDTFDVDLTPNAAAAIAARRDPVDAHVAKRARTKRQMVDAVTELEWAAGRRSSLRYGRAQFLPRSRLQLRLLEIESDVSYNLPRILEDGRSCWAPLGLAPELQLGFAMPTRMQRIIDEGRLAGASVEDDDVELGRRGRASSAFSGAFGAADDTFGGFDPFAGAGEGGAFDGDLGGEDVRFDGFEIEGDLERANEDGEATLRASANEAARRASYKPVELEDEGEVYVSQGPLVVFDSVPTGSSQSVTQKSLAADEESAPTEAGLNARWSRNTVKALGVLKEQLGEDGHKPRREKKIEFGQVADKASKRAAASFFFETLMLTTRDCLKVSQDQAYGKIEIQAKDRLWTAAEEVLVA